jgi:hypothetical protein
VIFKLGSNKRKKFLKFILAAKNFFDFVEKIEKKLLKIKIFDRKLLFKKRNLFI